ncbi:MAG: cyclic nucleotide-binding domain-containing protein [Deltaproteobacteria bacterium]|nr:cyclic nucleotide-binding domain-containing protein [Deltaproteobacteria bacterium]
MARKDPNRLREEAANAVARGKHDVALKLYSELEELEPANAQWSKRIGETHRRNGDNDAAIDAFTRAVDKYVGDGLLVQAIAVCKMILQIAPTHVHAATRLAELAMPSPAEVRAMLAAKTRPAAAAPATSTPANDPAREAARRQLAAGEEKPVPRAGKVALPPGGALDAIPLAAVVPDSQRVNFDDGSFSGVTLIPVEIALDDIDSIDAKRAALLKTPVFAQLPQSTLEQLIEKMQLVDLSPGAVVFCEGEPGDKMFVVSEGEVIVETNGHELARLHSGAFFGEIALVTDLPRSATARAVGRVELLAIDRALLREATAERPELIGVLLGFVRDRLVDRITRTSELFEPFTDSERRELAQRFEVIEVDAGTTLITQGTKADGLYIVMAGKAAVVRDDKPIAMLTTGDVFGEMSLMGGRGSNANVVAKTRLLALRMPATTFREVIMTYPQVLAYLGELSSRRSLLKQAEDLIDLHIDML